MSKKSKLVVEEAKAVTENITPDSAQEVKSQPKKHNNNKTTDKRSAGAKKPDKKKKDKTNTPKLARKTKEIVWVGYFGVLILTLPLVIFSQNENSLHYAYRVADVILSSGKAVAVYISFFYSVLVALCMFGFLYNTRSCGMIGSLPVKRESVFLTAYLTGLVPTLLADVLVVLLTALLTVGNEAVTASLLLQWLALAVMGNICFYGIAVFCAMLTGSAPILPAVYAVLNLAAFVAEFCAQELAETLIYGYGGSVSLFHWLSPLFELSRRVWQYGWRGDETPYIVGWGVLAAYCAAGLLLSAAALWLYRRRDMERATDTVAIPVLKPVFRTCMAVGTALVFAYVIYNGFLGDSYKSFTAAVLIALLLMAGAAIGYFAAEMLMQKTVRVFKGKWKGCLLVGCVLAALTFCLELDVFGIERYVPALDQVESLYITSGGTYYEDPANLEQLTELHRQIVRHKRQHENAEEGNTLYLIYTLKNGRTVSRLYRLEVGPEAIEDPNSDVMQAQRLLNVPEAVCSRNPIGTSIPLSWETLAYMNLARYDVNGPSYVFTAEEAMDYIETCLKPDMAEGTMGRYWFVKNDDYYDTYTSWAVTICLERTVLGEDGEPEVEEDQATFHLQMDAERSMAWFKEHTDADIQPIGVTSDKRR